MVKQVVIMMIMTRNILGHEELSHQTRFTMLIPVHAL